MPFNADINNVDDNWIQVTICGLGAGRLTEGDIEAALNVPPVRADIKDTIIKMRAHCKTQSGKERATFSIEGVTALLDYVEAALSAAGPSVAVKALEWEENTTEAIIGGYWVVTGIENHLYIPPSKLIGSYNTVEEAKAAAQADYEARIRSTLTAQLQDVVEPSVDEDALMIKLAVEATLEVVGIDPYAEVSPGHTQLAETLRRINNVLKGQTQSPLNSPSLQVQDVAVPAFVPWGQVERTNDGDLAIYGATYHVRLANFTTGATSGLNVGDIFYRAAPANQEGTVNPNYVAELIKANEGLGVALSEARLLITHHHFDIEGKP